MKQKIITGCIFVDTPKECSLVTPNGQCLGLNKFSCIFNHWHLVISDDSKNELMDLFKEEISSQRRYKHLSGLAGRKKEVKEKKDETRQKRL